MENTIQKAYAKLNLSLNLFPELTDRGYYRVLFINTQATLHDDVIIRQSTEGIIINDIFIDGTANLALSAAQSVIKRYQISGGIRIDIKKHIPVRAGLGGGSADAAAVINGLSLLFGLDMSMEDRTALAGKLGMDVCYCVVGGLCSVEGGGDRVIKLLFETPAIDILIAVPPETKPSTAWAYSILKKEEMGKGREKVPVLLDALAQRDIPAIARNLHNDFQGPIERHYPVTGLLRKKMLESGALGALLAGSGLAVFGIFDNPAAMKDARAELEKEGARCIATHTL